jgi:hypothetical protein
LAVPQRMTGDWDQRLGWTVDLIADSPTKRRQAQATLVRTRQLWSEALRLYNEVWNDRDHPEYQARSDAFSRAHDFTFPHALWRHQVGPMSPWEGCPTRCSTS